MIRVLSGESCGLRTTAPFCFGKTSQCHCASYRGFIAPLTASVFFSMGSASRRERDTSFHTSLRPVMRLLLSSTLHWRIGARRLPVSSIALLTADGSRAKRTPTIAALLSFGFPKVGNRLQGEFTVNWLGSKGKRFARSPGKTCAPSSLFCSRWKTRPTRRPAARKVNCDFS